MVVDRKGKHQMGKYLMVIDGVVNDHINFLPLYGTMNLEVS